MRRIAVAFLSSVALGGSAFAAERGAAPRCEPIDTMKAKTSGARFTPLTAGEFHFVAGFYAASPRTPTGNPPGDGALLIEKGGASGIIWTHGQTACITAIIVDLNTGAARYVPMPLSDDELAMMRAVRTGKGEVVPPFNKPVKGELQL